MKGSCRIRWSVWLAGVAWLVGGGLAASAQAQAQGSAASSWGTGDVVEVRGGQPSMQGIGGTVVPFREVTLTAQIGGRIIALAGREGDAFQSGDVLVRISEDRLQAQRQAALADLRAAESGWREAQVAMNREIVSPQSRNIGNAPGLGIPSMFDQLVTRPLGQFAGLGDPTVDRQSDLFSRSVGIEQAQARWLQARSRLEEIDAALADTRSVAPFDGVIIRRHVEEGDTVQPGMPLVTFGHVDFLRVEVDVPVRLVGNLAVGDVLPARIDAADGRTEVRVAQIFPMADPQRHTVTVKFDLPRGTPGGPGMYAEVFVPGASGAVSGSVHVPRTAVIPGGALPRVAVVQDDGTIQIRMVRLGVERDDSIEVRSGLSVGERVMREPAATVRSGDRVNGR